MSDFSNVIINPSETIIATLGNGYAQNFIATGSIGRSYTILTDRRVYFKGKFYNRYGARLVQSNEERIVDLKDITGSGFEKINPYFMILTSIIFFFAAIMLIALGHNTGFYAAGGSLIVFALIWLVAYFISRRTIFKIEYAGGNIGLDIRFISYDDAVQFNRCIRSCKDNLAYQGMPAAPIPQYHVTQQPVPQQYTR